MYVIDFLEQNNDDLRFDELIFGIEAITNDPILSEEIIEILISSNYLDDSESFEFNQISVNAFLRFQSDFSEELGIEQKYSLLGPLTARKLIEVAGDSDTDIGISSLSDDGSNATRALLYIQNVLKAKIFIKEGHLNIIYFEGLDLDFSENPDQPNKFNDLRVVIGYQSGSAQIQGKWDATTEPGSYYTKKPLNKKGAARIAFGQFRAWQVGTHGRSEPHEALIQTGGSVTVHRDLNQDMIRTNDKLDTGYFGINQHHGYDYPVNNIRNASAGCLVGRQRSGHREFMKLVKTDTRYLSNRKYVFYTTIIAGDKWTDWKSSL